MINPWLPILQSLSLSRTEREVVRRFEHEPEGRSFLPVADILRAHQLHDEAIELLTQGVERHPSFTVARVFLARDLLQKGLVEAAWRTLEDSPVALKDNLLAQKLSVRVALLLGFEVRVRQTLAALKINQAVDVETKRIADAIELNGFLAAREKLIVELKDRGTDLNLPPITPPSTPDPLVAGTINPGGTAIPRNPEGEFLEGQPSSQPPSVNPSHGASPADDQGTNHFEFYNAAAGASFLEDETLQAQDVLAAFHVVPLDEIFRPDASNIPQSVAGLQTGGVELDSTTLADIYERQGHYAKALGIYRRLLRVTPHSDLYRRKVSELVKLEKEQRDVELTIDPALVDRLESVEIIDRQIRFYNQLLSRLI